MAVQFVILYGMQLVKKLLQAQEHQLTVQFVILYGLKLVKALLHLQMIHRLKVYLLLYFHLHLQVYVGVKTGLGYGLTSLYQSLDLLVMMSHPNRLSIFC